MKVVLFERKCPEKVSLIAGEVKALFQEIMPYIQN